MSDTPEGYSEEEVDLCHQVRMDNHMCTSRTEFNNFHINKAIIYGIRAGMKQQKEKDAVLEAELTASFELAESQYASEKFAGNVVKQEFWKGELSALHRIRRIREQS